MAFPGDAPWISDEPRLISMALYANRDHRLLEHGLPGTLGIEYGPLPGWFYQAELLLTHDAAALVLIRAGVTTAVTAVALIWLGRSLQLWMPFIAVMMLSPYLWFYSRLLWDNSFCIPLGALLLAAYAAFMTHQRRYMFDLVVGLCLALPLVHLMALVLIVPLALHLIAFQRAALRRYCWDVLLASLAFGTVARSYWASLVTVSLLRGHEPGGLTEWVFPLMGGRFLTAWGLEYFFDGPWIQSSGRALAAVFHVAVGVSMAGLALMWAGLFVSIAMICFALRRRVPIGARGHIACLCVAAWLMQTIMSAAVRTDPHPHYYNATWICYALFAWLAVTALARRRWAAPLALLHGAALAFVLVLLIVRVHQTGGTRSLHYGTTLAQQVRAARFFNGFSPTSRVEITMPLYRIRPHTLAVLRKLDPPPPNGERPRASLQVRYRTPDGTDGQIEVVRLDPLP